MKDSADLPIIDQLERANSYVELAEILVRMPFSFIVTHSQSVREIVQARGFVEADNYVAHLAAFLARTRTADDADDLRNLPKHKNLLSKGSYLDTCYRDLLGRDQSWRKPEPCGGAKDG